jgi:hypothetical protein
MTNAYRKGDPATGWLDGVLILAVLALAGLLGCAVIRNSDIWMHLATGRLINAGQYQFGVDPFCHTTTHDLWINHAWGFDIGLYWVFQQFGGSGLVLMRCGIVLIMTLTLLFHRKMDGGIAVPAIITTLALVASNGRLPVFQPTVVSYMVLAILIWLLDIGPRWPRRWLFPVVILILHIYWVNHDGWFILGPCVIILWLLGSLLQKREPGDPSVGYWSGILVCALLGCLINPHHLRAFAISEDLFPTLSGGAAGNHPLFRSLYQGLFDADFHRSQPAPSYAVFALLGIGIASFAVSWPAKPWRRLIVWTALAVLASWRARLVPFFAVGSASLVSLNLQEWLARQEPSANRRMIGIALRSVAGLAVIGLCFAAWPGWLGPNPNNPQRMFRVGLRMETDAGMVQMAKKLADLENVGTIKNTDRVFSPAHDVAHYLAWFAPSLKSFADSRWRLHWGHIEDFLAARQFFTALDSGQPANLNQLAKLLQPFGANLLVISGSERGDGTGAGRVLFTDPERWPLVAIAGKATAFFCIGSDQQARQTLDVPHLAFAPQAAPHLPPPPDEEPHPPTSWESYVAGPKPRPIELDEMIAWTDYTDASQHRVDGGLSATAVATFLCGPCGDPVWPLRSIVTTYTGLARSPSRVVAPDRLAGAVLAVRHGRAALAAQNDNAETAYRLAQAFTRLASVDSMLTLQIMTALTQARSRLEVFAANGWDESHLAFLIANDLAVRHYQLRQFDLYVENCRIALEYMRRPTVAERLGDQKAYENEFKARQKRVEEIDKLLAAQREQLDQFADKPAQVRMAEADRRGLPGDALNIFQKAIAGDKEHFTQQDMGYAIDIMLRVGRGEDARAILHSPKFNPVTAAEPSMQPIVHHLHLRAAVACGDYLRARDEFEALLDLSRLAQANSQRVLAFGLTSGGIAMDPVAAPFVSRSFMVPLWWTSPLLQTAIVRDQRFEWLAWKGMLALEEGDTRTARRVIDEALEELPPGIHPPGWEQLSLYKLMLDRAAAQQPKRE